MQIKRSKLNCNAYKVILNEDILITVERKFVYISATNSVNAVRVKLMTDQTLRTKLVGPRIKTSLNLKRVASVEHGK
jgi:hypothetical protein